MKIGEKKNNNKKKKSTFIKKYPKTIERLWIGDSAKSFHTEANGNRT